MTRCSTANYSPAPSCALLALLAALSDAGNLPSCYEDTLESDEPYDFSQYPWQQHARDFDPEEELADEPDDGLITTHFTPGSVPTLSEREYRLLVDCLCYAADPYGAPGHLYKLLVAKLGQSIPAFRLQAD